MNIERWKVILWLLKPNFLQKTLVFPIKGWPILDSREHSFGGAYMYYVLAQLIFWESVV